VKVLSMTASKNALLIREAAAAGVAFGSVLWWASTCLVSALRPQDLPDPYWEGMPWLRTDTSGFAAFILAAVSLGCSKYLRFRRLQEDSRRQAMATPAVRAVELSRATAMLLTLLAVSETIAVLATGVVMYLSLNTITHPASLQIHVSHLLPWPAEGTLRIVALLLCVCSIATRRYLRPLVSTGRVVPGLSPQAWHQSGLSHARLVTGHSRTAQNINWRRWAGTKRGSLGCRREP